MSQQELVRRVIEALEEAGIEYMLTGSYVSSFQGEPRSTHDVDFVVMPSRESATRLAAAFPPPDFHLDERAMVDAIARKRMFNLLDVTSGDKVDFWLLTDSPFDRSRFGRRSQQNALGTRMYMSTPEDTILAKLDWAKRSGGSEKQFTDALRVYEVQKSGLDTGYLDHWARKLDVADMWQAIRAEAGGE